MIGAYIRLSRSRRRLAWRTLYALLWGARVLRREGYPACMRHFGTPTPAAPVSKPHPDAHPDAREVRWALQAVSRRLPWSATCLVQALAARRLLAHLPCTTVVGVRRNGPDWMVHAWLRQGNLEVTGAPTRGYQPVAEYVQAGTEILKPDSSPDSGMPRQPWTKPTLKPLQDSEPKGGLIDAQEPIGVIPAS